MTEEIEIIFRSEGELMSGYFLIADGLITVRSTDGRIKSTQIGGNNPETLARTLLLEMKREKSGGSK